MEMGIVIMKAALVEINWKEPSLATFLRLLSWWWWWWGGQFIPEYRDLMSLCTGLQPHLCRAFNSLDKSPAVGGGARKTMGRKTGCHSCGQTVLLIYLCQMFHKYAIISISKFSPIPLL